VRFRWLTRVDGLDRDGDRIGGVQVTNPDGERETLTADAIVMSLGPYSPFLLAPVSVPCLVYPAKGYSMTLDVGSHQGAPTVSLTDLAWKIVLTRLGNRLRVAGTAELSGYSNTLNALRCEALLNRTFDLFPDAGDRSSAHYWTGLRPATPSNVPLIGPTRYRNLYLNTGHGTLGWTMACGSGRLVADVIGGRSPQVDFGLTAA
jgi:D-amino-acid dehydrogenase